MQNVQAYQSIFQSSINYLDRLAPKIFESISLSVVVIFLVIILVRLRLIFVQYHKKKFKQRWQPVFLASLYGEVELEGIRRPFAFKTFLHEWNHFTFKVKGESRVGLIALLENMNVQRDMEKMIRSSHVGYKIQALITLTAVASEKYWYLLEEAIESKNPHVSITAFGAMVETNPLRTFTEHSRTVVRRRDWTEVTLGKIFSRVIQNRVINLFSIELLGADDRDLTRLLKVLSVFRKFDNVEFIRAMITDRENPYVLAGVMELMWNPVFAPSLRAFAEHDNWVVRKQAARLIGRLGSTDYIPSLKKLICDSSWWVRYRAAESLCTLPGMSKEQLMMLLDEVNDRYGKDILAQVMVEKGMVS